ncbi:sulfotransferase [Ornithinimicrobium cavernae]|uniref:sulfotransferase n=1 Tax=Ornithinimicrobium cavernae TaxID=2666047 RepID=UPI000D69470F|nr:sulfotransferase [Ornithinimicrobium cavernae]
MSTQPESEPTYLFVVTYGRSGSTTLQAILNSIPGFLIRGENRQALRFLHQYHRTLVKDREGFREMHRRNGRPVGMMTPSDPFYGIDQYPTEQALTEVRRLVTNTLLRPDDDTRVLGFKEIRWYHADVDEFVDWLREVFPGARFLVNSRRHADVAASGWWAKDPDAMSKLATMEETFDSLRERLGPAAHHVQYEDYVNRTEALEPLFEWLGEPFVVDDVRRVLATRHSY